MPENLLIMKNACLLSLLSMLSLPLFSIPNNGLVHDSTYYFVWDHDQNVWIDSAKHIFKYDENRNLLEESSYLWVPETGNWVLADGSRKELTYDAHRNIIQEIITTYKPAKGQWMYDRKRLFAYDDKGRLIERSSYTWNNELLEWAGDNSQFLQTWLYDQNGDLIYREYYSWNDEIKNWEAFDKFEWRYDEYRRIAEKLQYKWDREFKEWIGIMRHTWTYNTAEMTTGVIQYDWYPGLSVWIPKSLRLSSYNIYGQIKGYTEFQWDYHLMQWVCYGNSYTCVYDVKGNLCEKIDYRWGAKIKRWIALRRCLTSFDENGNPTENKFFLWDPETESWIVIHDLDRKVTTYDEIGNPVRIMHYKWETTDSSWNCDGMESLTYDATGKQTEWSRYGWDTNSDEWIGSCKKCLNIANDPCFTVLEMCGKITNSTESKLDFNSWREINTEIHYQWNFEYKKWDYSTKTEKYWSKPNTVVAKDDVLKTSSCNIYPNPFSDYTIISLPESAITRRIELIDLYGRTIRSVDHPQGESFRLDRNNLPGGTYIIRIHSDDIYTGRVIIR